MSRTIILLAIVCLRASLGIALDRTRHISQYGHSVWRVQDGYFGGTPKAITQTTDGYIWIRNDNGIFRFDGVRFVRWRAPSGEELPSTSVSAMLGARDGSLWIGTESGLAHLVNGRLTLYEKGWITAPFIEDRDGKIWFLHVRTGDYAHPLCQVLQGEVHCYGGEEGVDAFAPAAITQDASGDLLLGGNRTLARWRPGSSRAAEVYRPQALQSNPGYAGVIGLAPATDGSVWVGIAAPGKGGGLQRLTDRRLRPFLAPKLNGETLTVTSLLRDHQENLWVGTLHGLYKIRGKSVDHYGPAEGLSGDVVWKIFEDREGNAWVLTSGGLDMFRDLRIKSFSTREGLTEDAVESVAADRDGRLLVGTCCLQVLESKSQSLRTIWSRKGTITALLVDHSGRLWAGMGNKLFVREQGKFREITKHDGSSLGMIYGMAEDSDRNIWAEGVETKGMPGTLVRIRDLKVQEMYPPPKTPYTGRIVADPQRGIWLGLRSGELARFRDGRVQTFSFGEHPKSHFLAITAASDGSILGGTAFGVVGWKDGKGQILSEKNGLPCNYVSGVISDDAGDLWLLAQCGIIEIPRDQMLLWWDHPESKLNLRVFDTFDGFQSGLGHFNTSAKTPDGRLWFANGNVLQEIDPKHVSQNVIPPPVQISSLVADHKMYSMDSGIRLPALTRDIEIDYTALSYAAPQKVLFRYMLEGRDSGFQDAGTRRQAFYNDLRPGHYRFRVIACNSDGVWNENGAALTFAVAPAFDQTEWFKALCILAVAGVMRTLYWLRLRQASTRLQQRLGVQMEERERIAHELHDTLLQTFQGLIFRLQAVNDLLPEGKAKYQLEHALQRADEAMGEGRSAVYDLRSSASTTNDLAQAIKDLGVELATEDSASFDVVVEGGARDLQPIVRDETYRIAREALRNAFNHARANQIETEITYGERVFRLRIRDDGEGIPTEILEEGRSGHYGLAGMRERAKQMGGELEIWSQAKAGTEIELSVAGSVAYSASTGRSLFRLFRRKTG